MSNSKSKLICTKKDDDFSIKIVSKLMFQDIELSFQQNISFEEKNIFLPQKNIQITDKEGNNHIFELNKLDIIEFIDGEETTITDLKKIYENVENEKCLICLENKKDCIFYPCGHYYCCDPCSKLINICPICRNNIVFSLNSKLINL
tara:strand:- start:1118 stop:1558 length:441 start_codon:yes stop_codon:yes gene_type:complete